MEMEELHRLATREAPDGIHPWRDTINQRRS